MDKINKDQVKDYAQRKGTSMDEAEKWLASNLGCYPLNFFDGG